MPVNDAETPPVNCPRCGRAVAASRPECLYCGTQIPGRDERFDAETLWSPEPEADENAYSLAVVSRPEGEDVAEAVRTAIGKRCGDADAIFAAATPLPLARFATREEAILAGEKLNELGIGTRVVGDDALRLKDLPTRLATLKIDGNSIGLVRFADRTVVEVDVADVRIAVFGSIVTSRTETFEKRTRRGRKLTDESMMGNTELVADVYAGDETGFRIRSAGFDMSFLGSERSLIVTENFVRLKTLLTEICPNIEISDDYDRMRSTIDTVWPRSTQRGSAGLRRPRFGGIEFGTELIVSNEVQFLKYSRMRSILAREIV